MKIKFIFPLFALLTVFFVSCYNSEDNIGVEIQPTADKITLKADTFHLSAVSWSNIMMFAVIGVIYALANIYHWVDTATATTFALTVLFIQSPLLMAIGAFPTVQTAKVALEKIQSLQLADYSLDFDTRILTPNWQVITFKNIN